MSLTDFKKMFIMEADASDFSLDAVLSQPADPDGQLHPCAFHSHKLALAERNSGMWEKKLLDIKAAFEEWHHPLVGPRFPFQILTYHKNLEYLQIDTWTTARTIDPCPSPGFTS